MLGDVYRLGTRCIGAEFIFVHVVLTFIISSCPFSILLEFIPPAIFSTWPTCHSKSPPSLTQLIYNNTLSSSSHQYLPTHGQYYPSSAVGNNPVHIIQPSRPELSQRKRPKYTRSKTGCLTCRVKKIKVGVPFSRQVVSCILSHYPSVR